MQSNGELNSGGVKHPYKHRKLPEIPKDQEPYDVTSPPKKPARLRSPVQGGSDLHRPKRSYHRRSNSMTEIRFAAGEVGNKSRAMSEGACKPVRSKSTSMTDLDEQNTRNSLFSNDAILSRRCGSCHQRVFPEQQLCLSAQSYLFHTTCFSCAICNSLLDVTNYCYFTEHEKFYCFQHFHEISKAEEALGSDRKGGSGVGPGAFSGAIFSYTHCYNQQRKRKQMVKTLIELQQRRAILEKTTIQLEGTRKDADREQKLLLWKKWFDMKYEKMIIMKAVTELAYQVKESELCEEQEQIQRKLRRLKKRRDEGTREENSEQEKNCLQSVLDVIEKRDLLLLELEIERRRDDDEIKKLKSLRAQSENLTTALDPRAVGHHSSIFSNELLDECVIL